MPGIPLEQMESVFLDAAAAVTSAQRYLERRRIEGMRLAYSIPRASISTTFSFRSDQNGHVFLFWGRRDTHQENAQRLQFSLQATPNAPEPPPADLSPLARVLTLPSFLLLDQARDELAGDLLATLETPSRVTLDLPEPGGSLDDEIKRFHETLDQDHSEEPDDSIGIVSLRLDDAPESYLIVRLGQHPEGIFVLERQPYLHATVYWHLGASGHGFYYTPLRRAMATLRNWLLAGQPGTEQPAGDVHSLGFIPVADFVPAFWKGQVAARSRLRADALAQVDAGLGFPAFYQLADPRAELSYSVPAPAGASPDLSLVRSVVRIQIRDQDPVLVGPRADIRLLSPEYVITADGRTALLDFIQDNIEAILRHFPEPGRDRYRERLADRSGAAGAVLLLSYRGPTPVNRFLVVWPAAYDGQQREFAFRIRIEGERLQEVEFLFPIEDPDSASDPVPRPAQPLEAVTVSSDAYVGFHDFLHAIRIWNLKGRLA